MTWYRPKSPKPEPPVQPAKIRKPAPKAATKAAPNKATKEPPKASTKASPVSRTDSRSQTYWKRRYYDAWCLACCDPYYTYWAYGYLPYAGYCDSAYCCEIKFPPALNLQHPF